MSMLQMQYAAPQTVAEAVALLQAHADAKVVAGGQSLLPVLNLRMARPSLLVDITRIDALRGVWREGDTLVIGALTRHKEVARDAAVRAAAPLLAAAAGMVGHEQIRNRGTFGGSLAHGDAAAELVLAAVVLGAELELTGPDGVRRVAAADFFLAPLVTALLPSELVTAVRVPAAAPGTGWSFREHKPLTSAFPLVTAGAVLSLDSAGKVTRVRAAVGAVDLPACLDVVAERLVGAAPTAAAIADAARAGAAELQCEADHQASADYRRHLAALYLERALTEAAARAGGGA